MMIQTIIISILSILIIIVAFMIVLVGSIGILRIVVASVFEFDFVKAYKNRKGKEPTKKKNDDDLPRIYKLEIKGDKNV